MYKDHNDFKTPDDDTPIWRYMDYSKFIAMLEDKSLYFTRGDRFQDRFEGTLPNMVHPKARRLLEELREYHGRPFDDEVFNKLNLLDRRTVAINCWHMNEIESDAMWKLYLKAQGEGVAIKSTVGRLKSALGDGGRTVHIGAVEYIDYEKDEFEMLNSFSRFLHKRIGFIHEHELRALIGLGMKMQSGDRFDFLNAEAEVEFGLKVPVNLRSLIQEIRIAPGAKWLELVTLKVINRHELPVQVKCAVLDADPFDGSP